MEHLARAVMVRQVERAHVNAGKQTPQRRDPRVVRAVRATDEQRRVVEPDRVSAFCVLAFRERPRDRESGCLEIGPHRVRLASSLRFPRVEEDRAPARRDEHRVVHVDRVEIPGLPAGLDHVRAGRGERGAEVGVLTLEPAEVRRRAPAELLP